MGQTRTLVMKDVNGNPVSSHLNASTGEYVLNIHDADVHSNVINRYIYRLTGIATTLAVEATSGSTQITVVSAVGFNVNDYILINTNSTELTLPRIKVIAGNVLTLDRPVDLTHAIGDAVSQVVTNMASSIGSLASPVKYSVGPDAGDVWHLTRILFELTHGTAGDLGLFGDLVALSNGVLVRAKINGQYFTLTNWKQNSHMKVDMFDVEFDPRSGGGGSYGTTGRGTFKRTGAVVRLDGDTSDTLEIWIQDDITALTSFTLKAQGHFE